MSSYDIEHSVPSSTSNTNPTGADDSSTAHPPRRPDFSTFFSHVASNLDTNATQNPNAEPMPSDISGAYRMLAEGFELMRMDGSGEGVLDGMIEELVRGSEAPPRKVEGVGQEFLDELERVPRKALKKDMDCPICSNPFIEDPYPLVVRLPCSPKHMFDLECIAPWLRLHATCPIDRKNLVKVKKPPTPPPKKAGKEDEDEEWDDMYA